MNDRQYWIVSPNVKDDEDTVEGWNKLSRRLRVAFMGYGPNKSDHILGRKFAGTQPSHISGIRWNDRIIIARRHDWKPQIVGLGIVRGEFKRKTFKALSSETVSLRNVVPFKSFNRPPSGVPLIKVLQHSKALVQLHPEKRIHRRICEWMEGQLTGKGKPSSKKGSISINSKGIQSDLVDLPKLHQSQFIVRRVRQIIKATKTEAQLLESYKQALGKKGRKLEVAKYERLRCDGYEKERRNLIEAKGSMGREFIRMAVGQLLDYAFQAKGNPRLRVSHKAILLPRKPSPDIERWLTSLGINIVWREDTGFSDNTNGMFS